MSGTAPWPVDEVARRGDTRERLLTAAIELFGNQGIRETSMRDLASAVGIKAPGIYNYFSSKEQLLAEASLWLLNSFREAVVGPDDATLSPVDRCEGFVRRHIAYQLTNLELVRANDAVLDADRLAHLLPAGAADEVRGLMRDHLDRLTAIVADIERAGAAAETPPRIAALAILTMCDRVESWYRPSGGFSPDEVANHYWNLVRGMLGA
jgi:AcrR family transcriptional regulator